MALTVSTKIECMNTEANNVYSEWLQNSSDENFLPMMCLNSYRVFVARKKNVDSTSLLQSGMDWNRKDILDKKLDLKGLL